MKMRFWPLPAYAALAVLAVGCGGGGGGSAGLSPAAPQAPPAVQSAGRFVLSIPNATSSSARNRKGVSPAAVSISIAVTGVTPQIADISASSSLCTTAPSGRTCTIPVQAAAGLDTFTVNLFDAPNATGNRLSTATVQANVVSGIPFSVTMTLQGIIASVQFALATDQNGNSQGPDVGSPGSMLGAIVAKDASGNVIVGPYNSAVNFTSSDPSITITPSSITDSGQLISFAYDGVQANPVTLSAASGAASATFTVKPRTNVVYYQTPNVNPFRIKQGSDGKIYFAELGPLGVDANGSVAGINPGDISRFDPIAKSFATVTVGMNPTSFTFAPDGSIWVANSQSNTISHIVSFSTVTTNPVPTASSRPRDITFGTDGHLYFVEIFGAPGPTGGGRVATFDPATPALITEYGPVGVRARAQSINLGPDGNLWIPDSRNSTIVKSTNTGTYTAYPMPGPSPFPRFIANGSDGNMYVTGVGNQFYTGAFQSGGLYKLTPAGTLTAVTLPVAQSEPDSIAPGPSGTLVFSDLGIGAIGQVTTSGQVTEWPIVQGCASNPSAGYLPNGVTAAADGTIWYTEGTCTLLPANPVTAHLGHLIFASGWRVFPNDDTIFLSPVAASTTGMQLLGIAESADSSPFTVTSSNPAVASVASTSNSHNFIVTAQGVGTAMLTVTDKNGISFNKKVVVSSATATIQSVVRREP